MHQKYALKIDTAPAEEPITLAEAKSHIRVDIAEDDLDIILLTKAARLHSEMFTRRSFVTTTWKMTLDYFPHHGIIRMPRPPLASVTSIKYVDTDGTQQTLAASEYAVDTQSEPGRITEAFGVSWPSTRVEANAVEIVFVAGFGLAVDVPEDIKHAIKLLVGHWYENREDVTINAFPRRLPMAAESLLYGQRILEVA